MRIFPIAYQSGGHLIRGAGYGPETGAPGPVRIIAIHGYSSSKHRLDPLCAALAKAGHPVVSIDLPGHKLGATGGFFSSFEMAVRAALDAVDGVPYPRPTVFVGHSMGAATALVAAGRDKRAAGAVSLGLGYPVTLMRPDPSVLGYYLERWQWVDGLSPLEAGLAMDEAIPPALDQLAGRPFLLVSGKKDVELPQVSAKSLFERARDPKTWVEVDADHSGVPDAGIGAVLDWFSKRDFRENPI